ncbi:electron transfer flavoprotein subunit beta/FixA family protein, partial [bacterium]|nr:electron transfer flavoprotein subunit beta/FixA family protein [bacterium]
VANPYDEYAVEEAVRLAEKHEGATVTAVMAGSEGSRKNLVNVLALGVHDAVLIDDPALEGSDPLQIATVLKAAIEPLSADVILAGKQGVDSDWGLCAIALAGLMGLPHVGVVTKIELGEGSFRTESDGDDGKLVTEGPLPAVFTAEKALNEPRYASLKGIMAAKKKPIVVKTLAGLGLDSSKVGAGAARVKILGCEYPPAKQPGRIIEGSTVQEKVANLLAALRTEAKVI